MINIIKIQIGHYVGKEPFWIAIALLQGYIILSYLPVVVRKIWPYIIDCTIPDLDENGGITSL